MHDVSSDTPTPTEETTSKRPPPTDAEAALSTAMLKTFQKWKPGRLFSGPPVDPNRRRQFENDVAARRKANKAARKARRR